MKHIILTVSIVVLTMISGCEKSEWLSDGEFFHLSHKGAKMPVWVKGNFSSDVMIITLHGGPGDSGMEHPIANGYKYLENDYLMVYWDQRWSGMAQGHPDKETLHPDQFIDDTEKIVQLLKSKYPNKTLFLMGHSWGGQLAAGYLGRDNHQDDFNGWIDLDGSLYGDLEAQMMKDFILDRVPEEMAKPDADIDFWQFIIDWYEENPEPKNYSDPEPYWYVDAVGGVVYDYDKVLEENPVPYSDLIFRSMFSLSFYVDSFGPEEYIPWDNINYTSELQNMTLPSLLIWGEEDGIVPAELADYVYDNLATPASEKTKVIIPECGHTPPMEQPEVFYDQIKLFVETYK